MSDRLPLLLQAYRLATMAATPLAPFLLSHRLKRGKELPLRMAERYGQTGEARPDGPLVWLHGASVGEIVSALALIERLHGRGLGVLVTSGTVTSAEVAAQRLPAGVIHQFIPLDSPRFVARFVRHWRPDLALLMESDLWPNLIIAAAAGRIPLILLNARLSERSFCRWRRVPRTIAALMQNFELCLAQSQEDGRRYAAIGATVSVTGNLKLDLPAPPVQADALRDLRRIVGNRAVFAAASTHPGEEAVIIEAHRRLRQTHANLLTILAPRHPERGPDIAAAASALGLHPALRSRGEAPAAECDLYVFDTVGELGLLYRLVPIVFMGGSLVTHGGQNPIEAAKLGAAILHGPHVWNFSEIYAALDTARGAEMIVDSASLMAKVAAWLEHPNTRDSVAIAGRRSIDGMGGALERSLAALDPYLQPLLAKRQTNYA